MGVRRVFSARPIVNSREPMQKESQTRQAERAENLLAALRDRDAELFARELAGARGLSQAGRAWRERWAGARPFLHEIALSGWVEGMSSALLGGGGQALEERDEMGRTPFLVACFLGDEGMAWALQGAGASAQARSRFGWGALHWLAAGESQQPGPLASWLVRLGVSLWQPDELGLSAPFLANDAGFLAFCQSRAWAEGVRWELLSTTHGEPLRAVWSILGREKAIKWLDSIERAGGPKARGQAKRSSGLAQAVPAASSLFANAAARFARAAPAPTISGTRSLPSEPPADSNISATGLPGREGSQPFLAAVGGLRPSSRAQPGADLLIRTGKMPGLPMFAAAQIAQGLGSDAAAASPASGEPVSLAEADEEERRFRLAREKREAALRESFSKMAKKIHFFSPSSSQEASTVPETPFAPKIRWIEEL